MAHRRCVASFLISRMTGCEEYAKLLENPMNRVTKVQDFGAKDDVIRVVDYEDRSRPQYDPDLEAAYGVERLPGDGSGPLAVG